LTVRAGVGRAAPESLTQAARRLGISTRRAAALERSGLRRLREVGRSGACGQAAARDRRSAALGTGDAAVPPLQPAVLLASHPALTSPAKLAAEGARASATRGSASVPGAAAAGSGGAVKRAGVVATPDADSSGIGAYLAALAILALLLAAFVVAWRRRGEPGAPRLAEQTGTAAVWWPPTADDPEAAPAEPAPVAPEVQHAGSTTAAASSAPAGSDHLAAPDGGHYGEAPDPPPHPAGRPVTRRQGRPAAVAAAASLVSLGVALLRRRRRR
jgi:hypothetical protein